ncbi:SEC14-like protein 2 [Orchesella cincta]|uniref:SEC14-like protein 2 n=1 Tax=Orchesella cincta TaxID=48709 RepID=A0A1D2M7U1_ORCCI|nr:SEC14-like protein 2 [Orchesella cincta]
MSQMHFSTVFISVVVLYAGICCNVSAISVEKFLTMTLSQKVTLDKFRAQVMPLLKDSYMKHDTYLIRWLRARNFDINSAEAMLRENLKWRKQNAIDEMRSEDWSDIASDFHVTIDTYDKTGRPSESATNYIENIFRNKKVNVSNFLVGVIDIYDWDIRRAVIQGKGARMLRYLTSRVENITGQVYERQEQLGMNVTQIVVMGSAAGFNIIQHACPGCLPLWIQFALMIENYYPEILDELIVIDAPPTIQIVLEAIKPFITRSNREAIKVLSSNRSKWMAYLDNKISREERRREYGGTKPPFDF